MSIRFRICREGMTEDQQVELMRRLIIFDAKTRNLAFQR